MTLLIILIFIFLNSALYASNLRTAYSDLIFGKAWIYDTEIKNAYTTLKNSKEKVVELNDLTFLAILNFYNAHHLL